MLYLRICLLLLLVSACARYDVVVRGGMVYDGSGAPARQADVALRGDKIVQVGTVRAGAGKREVDARGLAVAPGFINTLSWANISNIADGRSLGDVMQGVTLQIMGEGSSMAPLSPAMQAQMKANQGAIQFDVPWTTLEGYFGWQEQRGLGVNIATLVGAGTVREVVIGEVGRPATPHELRRMRILVREAMEDGALGVGSSLIYAPGLFASTEELIALSSAAAEHGGVYMSHLRSEGNRFEEAVDEFLTIVRSASVRGQIWHLKAAGQANWPKLDPVLATLEAARATGLPVSADMYLYMAGSTGFDAGMPPWVQEGGYAAWRKRLQDPAIRARVTAEMQDPSQRFENLLLFAGPDNTRIVGLRNPALQAYLGKTLAQVSAERGTHWTDTAIDLVIEDGSRVQVIYELMSEANVRRQVQVPWISFGSDGASMAPEGVFLKQSTHPRAYGNFAKLLGHYVRDEKLITLEEAVRRLTSQPAAFFQLKARGKLAPGYFADLAIFDPARVRDRASYDAPHQLAEGMVFVFVNGVAVVDSGKPTGAKPGRAVRGPGWRGWGSKAVKPKP
jgi:N-acyl-D-amino-acid deacylase